VFWGEVPTGLSPFLSIEREFMPLLNEVSGFQPRPREKGRRAGARWQAVKIPDAYFRADAADFAFDSAD
jgi:hypothetical protein